MNIKVISCNSYRIQFPKASTFSEWFFSPRTVNTQDGRIAERVQRWLVDNGDFYSSVKGSLSKYVVDQGAPTFNIEKAVEFLNRAFLAESLAGRCLYLLISTMILRAIELFYQSANISLYASVPSTKIKKIINILAVCGAIGFALSYGPISANFMLPIVLEKFLSFKWSSYLNQTRRLSGTKEFELKDFCFRNFLAVFMKLIPTIFLLIYEYPVLIMRNPEMMTVCKDRLGEFFISQFSSNDRFEDHFLDFIVTILGKIIFDSSYIFALMMASKVTSNSFDLRDPMGWIFSKYESQVSSSVESQDTQEEMGQKDRSQNRKKRVRPDCEETTTVLDATVEVPGGVRWIPKGESKGDRKRDSKKKEPLDEISEIERKEPVDEAKKSGDRDAKQPILRVTIKVNNRVLTFQKLFYPSYNKEVWGVIITDSVEKQTLPQYWNGLANSYIGGGTISPLTGYGGKLFEIRPGIDSRLIGRMYDGGMYRALQNFMPLEAALPFSRELERRGVSDRASLIAFSAEAKKHKDINRVAGSL